MRRASRLLLPPLLACALAAACATSPLGRSQLILYPEEEMAQLGAAAYTDLKTKLPASADTSDARYVACVANAITSVLEPGRGPAQWEVTLFEEPSANAFALPGGKIGVHTGLLRVATNQAQLATVIGHEIGHVLAQHSNERLSTSFATQLAVGTAVSALGGAMSQEKAQLLGALGGIGAEYGVILPWGRKQEAEADLIGLDLMAKAGFDPRESVELWRNMAAASGGDRVPELLSTHPATASRIEELSRRVPDAMQLYERARAAGRQPRCR